MKLHKKDTPLTLSRDAIRLFLATNFYVLAKLLDIDLEYETEYIVLASIFVFGPMFCGWACPFGAASYFATRIGNELFPKLQFNIPQPYDSWLRYLRYPLLAYFIYLFTASGLSYFGDHGLLYDAPTSAWYFEYKHYAVLIAALFIPQFFCKYLCFQKAGYNIINKLLPITKIKRDTATCINCKKCDRMCPMQVQPSIKQSICGSDCLSCYNCLDSDACPKKARSLSLTVLGQEVPLTHFIITAITVYLAGTYLVLFVLKW